MSNYSRVLDEAINLTSTIRRFRTINLMVATYEQTKKGLGDFYSKKTRSDSLCLALAEENLFDCIQPEKGYIWEKLRENDYRDSFKADAKSNFFPLTCCSIHKKHETW